jgi:hypothetical protein
VAGSATAISKIGRFEDEWGFGDVWNLRYSRGRLRGAQTYLRKARAELLRIDRPGPAVEDAIDYIDGLLPAVAEMLAEADAIIAEAEAGS